MSHLVISLACVIFMDDPATAEREALLAKAQASVAAAAEKVKDDPTRPTFHILPPANWLNDPNGLLFYKGWYHVFYQHNPYGDDWGNMHWGHVRSKDLTHWEHLPIALWPSKSKGEEHVFSGSAWVRKDGTPILFYTSIGKDRLPEQWAAVPEDDDLIKWKKHPANPILTEAVHGETKIHEWRDPYLFEVNGVVHMVCGGNTNANKGGEGVVCVYRAENDELTKWKYLGVLFKHPDAGVKNVECPIFFKLDGRWVLITSQGQPVDWFVGDLDEATMRFTPKTRGKVDFGQVYAPSVLAQGVKRPLLWGWMNGVPGGKGWRHCLTMPRELSIDGEGRLSQQGVARTVVELNPEPGEQLEYVDQPAIKAGEVRSVDSIAGESLLLFVKLQPKTAANVRFEFLKSPDGTRSLPIEYDVRARQLTVGQAKAEVAPGSDGSIRFGVHLDRSIVEVYADEGRAWLTSFADYHAGDRGISARSDGGECEVSMVGWKLGSIWDHPRKEAD